MRHLLTRLYVATLRALLHAASRDYYDRDPASYSPRDATLIADITAALNSDALYPSRQAYRDAHNA